MSAIFYENDAQREAIERTRQKYVATPEAVQTEIAKLRTFWIAEDYHQKYALRHESEILGELRAIYPDEADFVASTAAARINGYLDGHGSDEQFEREVDRLGLSSIGQQRLRRAR